MTIVSNDPTWWPTINANRIESYFVVASFAGLTYDWALTFGQEVELIWRQRWSLMTVLYLSALPRDLNVCHVHVVRCSDCLADRYTVGVVVQQLLGSLMIATLYYHRCQIMYAIQDWTGVLVFAMLWGELVIIITRLYAMYQRSRKILIFLIVTFLAVNIYDVVVSVITTMYTSGEEFILSGTYQCQIYDAEYILILDSNTWILGTVWEVLALCLAVWITVNHFRELRRNPAGRDSFVVLIKTHIVYFVSFVAVSCFELILIFSPTLSADRNFARKWLPSDHDSRAVVCAGTTPDSWHSRIPR
ncbi:uncharacterized protein EDB93DRAFT_1252614 [Suillus bovinus]|uniref:uncharacterized protein n=1 Tax=Suillus bovinus TaxID=48563 RepID=UPI001B86023A|nr:uncharacterized protein EDB93DRAFT_1252614 [Suillus bovinus]KAG2141143.1 hypothetical protein EDB93DRAFT_1252614 [Suillus bovinus]